MRNPLHLIALAAVCAIGGGCASMAKVDEASAGPLKAMSDKLAAADQIAVSGIRRLDSQLIENAGVIGYGKVDLLLDRPDRAKVVIRGASKTREYYLSKEGSTIYEPKSGHYGQFPGQATVDKSLDAAAAKFGIHIPAQDFLSANPYRSLAGQSDTISHVGVESVGGLPCDHILGKRADLEWEMWIAQSDKLPRKFSITVAGLNGRNHYQVDIHKWDLNPGLAADAFVFKPSKNDSKIEVLPAVSAE